MGPGQLVELGKDGEIGYVSQKAPIAQFVKSIDMLIRWSCMSQGLSATAVSTNPSEASGISKLLDTREISELRIEDKLLWSGYEQKIFSMIRIL